MVEPKASTGRDSAPPDKSGTAADLGADRESVVQRSCSEDKPTEQAEQNKPEEEKNLDRDGGEKQPTDQSDSK